MTGVGRTQPDNVAWRPILSLCQAFGSVGGGREREGVAEMVASLLSAHLPPPTFMETPGLLRTRPCLCLHTLEA